MIGTQSFCRMLAIFFLSSFSLSAQRSIRSWTNQDGKTIEATIVEIKGEKAILLLKNRRRATVPLSDLSEKDQEYVQKIRWQLKKRKLKPMPDTSQVPPTLKVSGGPRVFRTEHFEFHTDQDVTPAFIREAALIFESCHKALRVLPFGIEPTIPEGKKFFQARFMNKSSFAKGAMESGGDKTESPNMVLLGFYSREKKTIFVPYSSLGAIKHGSRRTLRKSSGTAVTLIHEITHQLTDTHISLLPVWLSEGLAEFLASMPYLGGKFTFESASRGLRQQLQQDYGLPPRETSLKMYHPKDIMEGMLITWSSSVLTYRDSLLLTYYFALLDTPRTPGAPIAAAIDGVASFGGTSDFLTKYKQALEKYNLSVTQYYQEVDKYNKKISERKNPGPVPQQPKLPHLLQKMGTTPDEIFGKLNKEILPALLRGRSYEQLRKDIVAGYKTIGLDISFKTEGSYRAPSKESLIEAPSTVK